VDLIELYSSTHEPSSTEHPFHPDDAVQRFASIEITWLGNSYRRCVLAGTSLETSRFMGRTVNSVTLNFSNADENRYIASFVQNNVVEGLWCVVRTISETGSTDIDDSTIRFVGKCGKPGDFEDKSGSIRVSQVAGDTNQKIPPRKFIPNDPKGRQPSDKLFEGFRFTAQAGSLNIPTRVVSGFFNTLFNRGKKVNQTLQYSSHADFQADMVVPMVFGRCQMSGIHVAWIDYGNSIAMTTAWCEGVIKQFINLRNVSGKFTDIIIASNSPQYRFGFLGGESTQVPFNGGYVGNGYYSRTAMTACFVNGSELNVDEGEAPELAAIIMGLIIPLASEGFTTEDWSDNPVDIARYILTNDRLLKVNPAFIDDDVLIETASWCDSPLKDETNGEVLYVPNPDQPLGGDRYERYRSTGIIDAQSVGYDLGVYATAKGAIQSEYTGFEPTVPPGDPIPPAFPVPPGGLPVTVFHRKRYTCNVPITDEMPAIDFLHNVIFPSAKLYSLWSGRGRLQIKSERAADSARIRVATVAGDTSITVNDVTPWKTSLAGLVLIGAHLTTSEVRRVTAAAYSSATVSLTQSTAGSVTATLSGATLSGGSASVQASATVTIGGTLSGSITLTIGGFAVTYTCDAFSTLAITARMLAEVINADRDLRKFIEASASGAVVTLKSKLGTLTLGAATTGAPSALINTHATSLTQPTTAPTLASAVGSLSAGVYYVAYTFVRNGWETDHSEIASITLADGESIDVDAITPPAGATVNWYVSRSPGSTSLGLIESNSGAGINIESYPEDGSYEMPQEDMTAEEVVRIAMAFASNNQDSYPFWQASKALALNTIVLPLTPNGHKYKVTTAGTTAASEPSWPTTASGTVTNGSVVFTEFGATILGQAGLIRGNIYKDTVKWPLPDRQQSYNQFKGKFRDSKEDFALTPIEVNDYAHQIQINKTNPLDVDLSAVDNHDQASRLLNAANAKYRDGDYFLSHRTHARALGLEEGDVYCVSDASGGFVNFLLRAEEVRVSPAPLCDVSLVGRKYSSLMYADRARAHVVKLPTTLRFVATVDTTFVPLDIPIWRESDAFLAPGIYVAVNRPLTDGDWRGTYIYSDAAGEYNAISGKLEAQIPVGNALTTLSSTTNTTRLDTASTGRVQMTTMGTLGAADTLSSTTLEKLYNGANLAAWGAPGRWELIQFKDAALHGSTTDTYNLSNFLRGRYGTENHTSDHQSDDTFVLLTDADGNDLGIAYLPLDLALLNKDINLKAVTVNQDVADATAQSFTWEGLSRRSLAPIIEDGVRDSAGDLLIRLTGRSRIGGGLRSDQAGAANEETLEYRVQILDKDNDNSPILPNGQERVMTVLPGMALAAFLESDGNSTAIEQNSWRAGYLEIDHVTGRTIREMLIPGADNSLEATLIQDADDGGWAAVGLQNSSRNWRGLNATTYINDWQSGDATLPSALNMPLLVILQGFPISTGHPATWQRLVVYEEGVRIFSASSDSGESDYNPDFGWFSLDAGYSLFRVRFEFVGSTIVVKKAHTAAAILTRICAASRVPDYPLFALFTTASNQVDEVRSVFLTNNPYPKTIYSAKQMREDFLIDESDPLPETVVVKAWQHSKTVGQGQAGIKEI
jgi:hypothetical protein